MMIFHFLFEMIDTLVIEWRGMFVSFVLHWGGRDEQNGWGILRAFASRREKSSQKLGLEWHTVERDEARIENG